MISEDKALLANIASILVKDIGLDKKRQLKECPLILFDDSDDELDDFIHEIQMKRHKLSSNPVEKYINDFSECYYSLNLLALDNKLFNKSLHMTENTYVKLIETLSPLFPDDLTKINSFTITKESIISLGLWKATTDEHFHIISKRFELPKTICILLIKMFYDVVALNYQKFIKWPKHPNEIKSINNFKNNSKICSIFKNLYGILGCKSMAVFLEDQNDELPFALNICCNGNDIITYSHIINSISFDKTPLGKIINDNEINIKIPNDYYLIGDCSFPLGKHLITPFQESFNEEKNNFNTLIKKTTSIASDVFKKMFQRFHTLFALEASDIEEVRKITLTICILHNLCQELDDKCVLEDSNFEFRDLIQNKCSEDDADGLIKRLSLMESIQTK